MATQVIDILTGREYIFNKTFGTSTGGTSTPIWGGIGGTITNQVDLMNYFSTKVSNSTFTGYTATTDLRINALVNDYDHYDIETNILALNPSGYSMEKFWSTDTKREYISEYVQTIGGYRWLSTSLLYNPDTDTFYLGETADGQSQNLGQEMFLLSYNTTTSNITTNNPKVFLSVNSNTTDNSFMDVILARADDITDGSIYGLNTTGADSLGYFKLTTYGLLNNVDTADWAIGTELYVSDTTRGELTSIKPENNAHVIGFVLKQDADEGIIFVNTVRSVPNIDSLIPIAFDYSYFNGDLVTTTAGTFYLNLRNDKGSVTASTQTVSVADNAISGITRDSLSVVFSTNINYSQGTYRAKFEVSVNIGQANEKIYLEVYKADEYGNVIDSGITGETTGSLGVKPFLKLSSSILNLQANTVTPVIIEGLLRENAGVLVNQRFRFHILCEKVGAAGGSKTFTIYYGSNYDTWLRFPHYIMLNELYDVDTTNSSAGTFLKKGTNGIWTGENIVISDVSGLTETFDIKYDKTGGTISGDVIIESGLTVNNLATIVDDITYGTPIDSSLPTFNLTFTNFTVFGSDGPNVSNITSWGVNWNLSNNSMYTFAFGTSNGVPSYYVDLLSKTTFNLNIVNPYLTISGSNVTNLDGKYYINYINGTDFVLANDNGNFSIYMSTNPISYIPQTFGCNIVSVSDGVIRNTEVPVTYYGSYIQFISSSAQTTTTNTTPVVKCQLSTNDLEFGNYRIVINFTHSHTSTSSASMFDLYVNSSTIGTVFKYYPSNTLNVITFTKSYYMVMSGVNTIQLRYWNESSDSTTISDASIEIIRIN